MGFGLDFGSSKPSHGCLWVNFQNFGDFSYCQSVHTLIIGEFSKNVKKYGTRLLTNLERYGTMLNIGDINMGNAIEFKVGQVTEKEQEMLCLFRALKDNDKRDIILSYAKDLAFSDEEICFAIKGYILLGWRGDNNKDFIAFYMPEKGKRRICSYIFTREGFDFIRSEKPYYYTKGYNPHKYIKYLTLCVPPSLLEESETDPRPNFLKTSITYTKYFKLYFKLNFKGVSV